MVNIAELHKLPSLEKLKIIELLWDDLEEDSLQSLSWHQAELKKTEADFLAGNNIKAVDWQQAKKELRARFA